MMHSTSKVRSHTQSSGLPQQQRQHKSAKQNQVSRMVKALQDAKPNISKV